VNLDDYGEHGLYLRSDRSEQSTSPFTGIKTSTRRIGSWLRLSVVRITLRFSGGARGGPSAATGRYAPMIGCIPTGSSPAARQVPFYLRPYENALPELLGKRNDDALRAADVTEPVHVLIPGYFAYELSAMGAQAREDILNVVDGEHDATY